jgi:hypothetical protein
MMNHMMRLFLSSLLLPILLATPAHAEDDASTLSPAAQKIRRDGFIPFDKKHAPMTIVRGGQKTNFIPLPEKPGERAIPLQQNRYYALPARPDGPVVTRPRPNGMNADPVSANLEAIRKQQVLDAASKLPTSLQSGDMPIDTHGVRVIHGASDAKVAPQRRAPSSSFKPPASAIPKGDKTIAPDLRHSAAERAGSAGSKADPLDILMKSAP